jgi:hypothetical protein
VATNNAEYEEFSLGERVRITTGSLAGETGHIAHFEVDGTDVWIIIDLDNIPNHVVPVLPSMVEKLEYDAPEVPPHGMTSEQLAEMVGEFMAFCQSRVRGVGNEQYDEGTHQKFEAMALDELIEYTVEELSDIVNYSTMVYVRLKRIQEALKPHL